MIMTAKIKKICVVTANRSDYGRLKPIMRSIQKDMRLTLQVVAGTPLFFDHFWWYLRHGEPLSLWRSLRWYMKARFMSLCGRDAELARHEHLMKLLVADGFPIDARLPMFLEGGNQRVMTKTIGFCLLGLPDIFEKLRPDIVLFNGDRFEVLPIALAAVSMNIPIAHIEGGDLSGTIDESVRHAVSKLAHIHFPATKKSAERLVAMGENPQFVFPTGSPVIDTLVGLDCSLDNSLHERHHSGGGYIDFTKPFMLVLQHPVTTRYEKNQSDMKELIAAVDTIPMQKVFLTPNIDAGSDGVSAALRDYRKQNPRHVAFYKYFTPHDYYRIFSNASVVVGNSSSLIREGAFLGTPAVVVGDRQRGRERGENVIETGFEQTEIAVAIKRQLNHGKYPSSTMFGDGTASVRITDILATIKPPIQKVFYE